MISYLIYAIIAHHLLFVSGWLYFFTSVISMLRIPSFGFVVSFVTDPVVCCLSVFGCIFILLIFFATDPVVAKAAESRLGLPLALVRGLNSLLVRLSRCC